MNGNINSDNDHFECTEQLHSMCICMKILRNGMWSRLLCVRKCMNVDKVMIIEV